MFISIQSFSYNLKGINFHWKYSLSAGEELFHIKDHIEIYYHSTVEFTDKTTPDFILGICQNIKLKLLVNNSNLMNIYSLRDINKFTNLFNDIFRLFFARKFWDISFLYGESMLFYLFW